MLDCPPSRSLLHATRFLRFLRSSSRVLALSRTVVPTLSPSRSIAFCVVFTLVSLLSRFSQLSPATVLLLPSPVGNFSVSTARTSGATVSLDFALAFPRAVSFVDPFLPLHPLLLAFYPLAPGDALTSSLPFDHNSRLTNIVNTLGAFGGNFGPARLVKFHYEINPGEYSYSERRRFAFLLLFIIVFYCPSSSRPPFVPVSNFITNCNKYHFARVRRFEFGIFTIVFDKLKK